MAGIDRLYLWKNSMNRKMQITLLVSTVLLASCAAGTGYYYFVYHPEKVRQEALERQRQERQRKIASVKKYYQDTLSGGDITALEKLALSIQSNVQKLDFLGFSLAQMKCTPTGCAVSFSLKGGRIFNVADMTIDGKDYSPSFSATTLDYSNIPSGLNVHPWLTQWGAGKQADLPGCTSMLSAINTWNSMSSAQYQIEMSGMPSSAAADQELSVKDAINSWQLMSVKWKLQADKNISFTQLVSVLARQKIAQAFVIKSIELKDKFTLSGELVCKKGL